MEGFHYPTSKITSRHGVVLVQLEGYRSVELQDRNKSLYLWLVVFDRSAKTVNSTGRGYAFQQKVLGQLDINKRKNELRPFIHITKN